jgi:hypothetical protein
VTLLRHSPEIFLRIIKEKNRNQNTGFTIRRKQCDLDEKYTCVTGKLLNAGILYNA